MRLKRYFTKYGFTLIELMIVVAIIGILAAVAIPNYARYQSKTRQAEAKIALSGVYVAEQSFYGEYAAFIPAMNAIGYSPEGFKRYYAVGWSVANTGAVSGFSGDTSEVPNFGTANTPAEWVSCTGQTATAALPGPSSSDDVQVFTAGASGQLRANVGDCDNWTINNTRQLQNTQIAL